MENKKGKEIHISLQTLDVDDLCQKEDNNIGNLFCETNDDSAPIVNTNGQLTDIVVPHGYISSAITLLTISENIDDYLAIDGYLNTALYCFRTYLEISMKDTLLHYGVDKSRWGNGARSHNLLHLWGLLKSHFEPVDDLVGSVENVVKELSDADRLSTTFRYPQLLNKIFPNQVSGSIYAKVNVKQMKRTMLQLYRFFEGINNEAISTSEQVCNN